MKRLIIIITILFLSGAGDAQAQRLRIVVGGANFRPYPVAVSCFHSLDSKDRQTTRMLKEYTSILRKSVDLVRPLELVSPKTYLASKNERVNAPDFPDWMNVGASGLITSALIKKGQQIQMTLRFFDVVAQRELLTRSYTTEQKAGDKAIHQFVDELVEMLTGTQGILSSRIAWVKRLKKGKAVFTSDIDGRNEVRMTPANVLSLLPEWGANGKYLLYTSYLKNNPDLYRQKISTKKLEWLSHKRGLNTGANVSPDGKKIALTLSIDGNTEIYVMNWDGKNLKRLTDSWGQDVSPTWSPDSKRLAFVSSRSGNPHIYVMNADGSAPKRLTFKGNYNQEPDWSPKAGGQIAFTARDERLKYDIFLVSPEDGQITRLTQDEGNNESPSHSPDGHHLVFTSTRGSQRSRQVYVMDIDGNNQRRISRGHEDHETPSWGPIMGYSK
ncbi:PD40 domain-containing protein [Myxococcota bacterium]|nr:PD40 domain-containing protein [Myxococcota bacterium]